MEDRWIVAKIDTLAFCLWVPIVRCLKQRKFDDIGTYDLSNACYAACFAEQLAYDREIALTSRERRDAVDSWEDLYVSCYPSDGTAV